MELSDSRFDIRTGGFSGNNGSKIAGNVNNRNFLTEELQRKLLEARRICWSLLNTGVCSCCSPEDLLTLKLLTGGLSNILVKVKIEKERFCDKMLKANGNLHVRGCTASKSRESNASVGDCTDKLATNLRVRFFNQNRRMFINEKREMVIQSILSNSGFLRPVVFSFSGGQVEEFIEGRTLEVEDVRTRDVYLSIAKKIAHLHSIRIPSDLSLNVLQDQNGDVGLGDNPVVGGSMSIIWPTLSTWLSRAEKIVNSRMCFGKVNFDKLNSLIRNVKNHLYSNYDSSFLGPNSIVISHCDLLPGNIIETNNKDHVFIDYEFSGTAERAFDLGNHFCEWAGFSCEWKHLPTDSQLREFIREYLGSVANLEGASGEKKTFGSEVVQKLCSSRVSENSGGAMNSNSDASGSVRGLDEKDYGSLTDAYVGSIKAFMVISNIYWGLWAICKSEVGASDSSNTCFDYKSYGYRKLCSINDEAYFRSILSDIDPSFEFPAF